MGGMAVKICPRLKYTKKKNNYADADTTISMPNTQARSRGAPPSVRSVKLNKFNSSSQLDGRMELINLSILGLDHWTEPHRRVCAQRE